MRTTEKSKDEVYRLTGLSNTHYFHQHALCSVTHNSYPFQKIPIKIGIMIEFCSFSKHCKYIFKSFPTPFILNTVDKSHKNEEKDQGFIKKNKLNCYVSEHFNRRLTAKSIGSYQV